MPKSQITNAFQMAITMANQPNKKFSTNDFLQPDISLRTIQRQLKQLEQDGKVIGDNCNPRGYKLNVV